MDCALLGGIGWCTSLQAQTQGWLTFKVEYHQIWLINAYYAYNHTIKGKA